MGSRKNATTHPARIASTPGTAHKGPPRRATSNATAIAMSQAIPINGHPSRAIPLQFFSRDPLVGVAVALTGRGDHLGRQRRRRGFAVPFALTLQICQVVAQRLLVETGLTA